MVYSMLADSWSVVVHLVLMNLITTTHSIMPKINIYQDLPKQVSGYANTLLIRNVNVNK